jgi:hypothetical protein
MAAGVAELQAPASCVSPVRRPRGAGRRTAAPAASPRRPLPYRPDDPR